MKNDILNDTLVVCLSIVFICICYLIILYALQQNKWIWQN